MLLAAVVGVVGVGVGVVGVGVVVGVVGGGGGVVFVGVGVVVVVVVVVVVLCALGGPIRKEHADATRALPADCHKARRDLQGPGGEGVHRDVLRCVTRNSKPTCHLAC